MAMQVISVVGALMVLIAYALIQAGTWRELDAAYLALNIIGRCSWESSPLKIGAWGSSCWNSPGPVSRWSEWPERFVPGVPHAASSRW